ncbi:MAG TPA: hypothetical protein VHM19_20380 [Polyangiales bacterium]|jgi:hypothetical protein|nr:hypothetical protein [Polyangiales bacterium]
MLRARVGLLLLLASVTGAACTGSESQVFTPWKAPVHIGGGAGQGADAAPPAADGGGPDQEDAGTVKPPAHVNPGLDPDAQFIWTETSPGHAGKCEPGTYTGNFECMFDLRGGFSHLIGSVQVTLGTETTAHQLPVDAGHITGFTATSQAFAADLDGQLDCSTARFEASTANSMTYEFPQGFEGKTDPMSIDGTLGGDFDAEALSITGDVLLTTSDGWKCTGKFHAQLSR